MKDRAGSDLRGHCSGRGGGGGGGGGGLSNDHVMYNRTHTCIVVRVCEPRAESLTEP